MSKIYILKLVCNNTILLDFSEIMKQCSAALQGGDVNIPNVPVAHDGAIDLEDYIEQIKEEDKDWAKRHSIQCL